MALAKSPGALATARAEKFGVVSHPTPRKIAESLRNPQAKIPSKATLARRWPGLRLNRFTGAWRDDDSGARGDNIKSLLVFLDRGRPTR